MKVLALLFLIGCASASIYDVLDDASEDLVVDFLVGMEKTPSLSEVIGYSEEAEQIESDVKTELGKTLREALDNVLAKIRDAVDHGKKVGEDLVNKAKDIASKLKEVGVDAGSKAKELLEKIKEKAKDWLKNLLEKFGISRRGISDWLQGLLGEFDLKSLLQKLKDKIAEKINIDAIVAYVKKLFGDSAIGQVILRLIKEKGLSAIKDLITRVLPSSYGSEDYAIVDMWEKIKDFFKDLGVQIKDHFGKLAEWLRETVKTGFENAKNKAEQLKLIAKEVIEHSKTISKEAAREALELLRPYKEDLGALWDQLRETVRKVISRSDDF